MCRVEYYEVVYPDGYRERKERIVHCWRGTRSSQCPNLEYGQDIDFARPATADEVAARTDPWIATIAPRPQSGGQSETTSDASKPQSRWRKFLGTKEKPGSNKEPRKGRSSPAKENVILQSAILMGNDDDYQHGGAGHHRKQGQSQDRFRETSSARHKIPDVSDRAPFNPKEPKRWYCDHCNMGPFVSTGHVRCPGCGIWRDTRADVLKREVVTNRSNLWLNSNKSSKKSSESKESSNVSKSEVFMKRS